MRPTVCPRRGAPKSRFSLPLGRGHISVEINWDRLRIEHCAGAATSLGLRAYDPRSRDAVMPAQCIEKGERFEGNESAECSCDDLQQRWLVARLGDNNRTEDQFSRRPRPQTFEEDIVRDHQDEPENEIGYSTDELHAPLTKDDPDQATQQYATEEVRYVVNDERPKATPLAGEHSGTWGGCRVDVGARGCITVAFNLHGHPLGVLRSLNELLYAWDGTGAIVQSGM